MVWNLAVNPMIRFSAAECRTTQTTEPDPARNPDMVTRTLVTEIPTGMITDLSSQNHVTQGIRLVTQHVTIDTVTQDILVSQNVTQDIAVGQNVTQDILMNQHVTQDILMSQHVTQDIPVGQNVTQDFLMSHPMTLDILMSQQVIQDIRIRGAIPDIQVSRYKTPDILVTRDIKVIIYAEIITVKVIHGHNIAHGTLRTAIKCHHPRYLGPRPPRASPEGPHLRFLGPHPPRASREGPHPRYLGPCPPRASQEGPHPRYLGPRPPHASREGPYPRYLEPRPPRAS